MVTVQINLWSTALLFFFSGVKDVKNHQTGTTATWTRYLSYWRTCADMLLY